jgi:3-oxoacyl-[acyl-carrier protein] reductase
MDTTSSTYRPTAISSIFGASSMAGEVVLITGAAGPDIGRATAQAFLELGARVIVTDRNARRVEDVTSELRKDSGDRVTGLLLDLRQPETFPACLDEIKSTVGSPTVLVNNAAITKIVPMDEMTSQEWDDILAVNVRAAWQLSCLVAPDMKLAGTGAIVNISSVGAYSAGWLEAAYCVSKAGLNALTRDIAKEWGPHGIRCNTVAPAFVDSKFIRDHWSKYEMHLSQMSIGRFIDASEVAATIVFLASRAASAITGEVIAVTGGWYMAP